MVTDQPSDAIEPPPQHPGDPMQPTATAPDTVDSTEAAIPPSTQSIHVATSLRTATDGATAPAESAPVIELRDVSFYYGAFRAVKDISIKVPTHQITALIGPSGSGKSTLLRTMNRMNDLIPGTRVEGSVVYQGEDLYASYVDPVEVRRHIGMVFQKPNPFPTMSIYDNVVAGLKLAGRTRRAHTDEVVERSL
jgi:ABC-type glutathione transport system ATPase component